MIQQFEGRVTKMHIFKIYITPKRKVKVITTRLTEFTSHTKQ